MTESEKLIITMLNRLFWLVTAAPGVGRHAKDVNLFADADSLANPEHKEANDAIKRVYEK